VGNFLSTIIFIQSDPRSCPEFLNNYGVGVIVCYLATRTGRQTEGNQFLLIGEPELRKAMYNDQ
jgi:hypothetical protein